MEVLPLDAPMRIVRNLARVSLLVMTVSVLGAALALLLLRQADDQGIVVVWHAALAALAGSAWAALTRVAVNRLLDSDGSSRFLRVAPAFCLLFLALALTGPGTPWTAVLLIWGVFLIEETLQFAYALRLLSHGARNQASPSGDAAGSALRAYPAVDDADEMRSSRQLGDPEEDEVLDGRGQDVRQQMARTVSDGMETIATTMRVAFQAGQKHESAHLAFCPPLAETPEIEAYQLDGPEAQIKPTQVASYGVRLDIRLFRASDQDETILLHVEAISPSGGENASDLAAPANIEQASESN